jgi:glucokinase
VADIGGSEARFALVRPDGTMTRPRAYPLNDYPSLVSAIDAYLGEETPPARPVQAVLAVAAPVTGDQVTLTNHSWTFSIEAVRQHLELRRIRAINDLAAHAIAIPRLGEVDRIQIGPGAPVAGAPIGLIAPGTGLGISALIPTPNGAIAVEGEGGHVTMAPADEQESAVLDLMRRRYGHVSAERCVSGLGLVNLYTALCDLARTPAAPFTPAEITNPQTWNEDPRTREATMMFCAMLGTVAGNLALTLGSHGGIYMAGGIVPKLGTTFAESGFRARFEAKGRFRGYLAAIPSYVVTRPLSALVGAATLLKGVAGQGPDPGEMARN